MKSHTLKVTLLLVLIALFSASGSAQTREDKTLSPYFFVLGIPLANGAYRQGNDFWEHSLFLLIIPPLMILPFAAIRFFRPVQLPLRKH